MKMSTMSTQMKSRIHTILSNRGWLDVGGERG